MTISVYASVKHCLNYAVHAAQQQLHIACSPQCCVIDSSAIRCYSALLLDTAVRLANACQTDQAAVSQQYASGSMKSLLDCSK
jgi:hypothetical protein